jgi:tetratricopeptide (TPR) repeat protein
VETNPGGYLQELGGTHRNLGHLYSKIGRLKEAAQEYEKAIDIYQKISTGNLEKYVPVVLELMNLLGNVYLKDERPDEAQQVFDEARRSGNGGIPSDKDTEPKP